MPRGSHHAVIHLEHSPPLARVSHSGKGWLCWMPQWVPVHQGRLGCLTQPGLPSKVSADNSRLSFTIGREERSSIGKAISHVHLLSHCTQGTWCRKHIIPLLRTPCPSRSGFPFSLDLKGSAFPSCLSAILTLHTESQCMSQPPPKPQRPLLQAARPPGGPGGNGPREEHVD